MGHLSWSGGAVGAGGENHARRGRGFRRSSADLGKKLRLVKKKVRLLGGNRRTGLPNIELEFEIMKGGKCRAGPWVVTC